MPLKNTDAGQRPFFGDPVLDDGLPRANQVFWASLISHIEQDSQTAPRLILDIGCHTGGLLLALTRRFASAALFGIEPLADARMVASGRLQGVSTSVRLLDPTEWEQVPSSAVDLITCHEVLYLESDLEESMARIRRVIAPSGLAYIVLGAHTENPLWQEWKRLLIAAGRRVYDYSPLEIMKIASSVGLLASVQPLRRSGWVTYDPLRADFLYPDVRTMLDHHYRQKLIFRLRIADDLAINP